MRLKACGCFLNEPENRNALQGLCCFVIAQYSMQYVFVCVCVWVGGWVGGWVWPVCGQLGRFVSFCALLHVHWGPMWPVWGHIYCLLDGNFIPSSYVTYFVPAVFSHTGQQRHKTGLSKNGTNPILL